MKIAIIGSRSITDADIGKYVSAGDEIVSGGATGIDTLAAEYAKRNGLKLTVFLPEYEKYGISSARDGVIQRFEFCTELAWKSAREYLLEEGYTDINSPKAVMKEAYSSNLIDDEKIWVELLYSRNLTSHIYDEGTASEIYYNIRDKYTLLFKKLIEKLEG